jgi:hypothetical protein
MAVAAAIYYNIFMLDHEDSNLKRKKEKNYQGLKEAFSVKLVNGKPI